MSITFFNLHVRVLGILRPYSKILAICSVTWFVGLPCCLTAANAQVAVREQSTDPLNTLILVVGAGGEEEYTKQFAQWADQWTNLAQTQKWNLIRIGTEVTAANIKSGDETDLQKLEKSLTDLASTGTNAETQSAIAPGRIWLVLIGHGTAAGKTAKFNLLGPDVTSTQLKSWLDKLQRETVIIDCTSSSAPFLVELSSKNRVVVSATKSGSEINYARFGGYFASALRDAAADLDHDNEISLLEAFLKASKETERFYRENTRLATEHALLDDNHDRTGTDANFYVGAIASTAAAGGKQVDGKRAARIILWSSPTGLKLTAEQAAQRDKIEADIDRLREQKNNVSQSNYYDELEKLMLQLSAVYDAAEQ